MKKINFIMALALPALIMGSANDANAQRANHTRKDAPTSIEQNVDEKVKNIDEHKKHDKKEHKKHHDGDKDKKHDKHDKHKKHHDEKVREDINDVEKDYQKALKKIDKSSFDSAQKDLLRRQAKENMELEKKHIKERADMMGKHFDERRNDEAFQNSAKADKANRKAIKKVRDILD